MKLKLIEGWRGAWKLFSMQANALGLAIVGSYAYLPSEFKAEIPSKYVAIAAGVTFILGMVGRMIQQPNVLPPPTAEEPK